MEQDNEVREGGRINGISLASFLQLLEQERKSCLLVVKAEGHEGKIYFEDGEIIDAEYENEIGRKAAYAILSWDKPSFSVDMAQERMRRITMPLAHILLDAAKTHDEYVYDTEGDQDAQDVPVSLTGKYDTPVIKRLLKRIFSMSEIKHYYLLSRQGKVISQSSREQKFGDFITYCIVSGIQMKKTLNVKGPNQIHLVLDNGEILLIMPGAGLIIGLLLKEGASVSEVADQVRAVSASEK